MELVQEETVECEWEAQQLMEVEFADVAVVAITAVTENIVVVIIVAAVTVVKGLGCQQE